MLKSYKYRLYPSLDQKQALDHSMNVCRLVYNLALELKIWVYRSYGINMSHYNICSQLKDLRGAYPWIKQVDSQALQASIKRVDAAYTNFFRGAGYPKFKKKLKAQSFKCPNGVRRIDWEKSTLTIPKIKDIPIRLSKKFEGKIKTVTIAKTATGKYFASITVDDNKKLPDKAPTEVDTSVGIDVGLKHFVILSDGTKVENSKYLDSKLKRLACLQRRLAKKQKGSKNREKARLKVALIHEKITNQRQDFTHKLSTAITKQYDTVCVESLTIGTMLKNRNLSRSISDVGWREFLRQLKYKQEWRGGNLLELPKFYPSSKKCSTCGELNEALVLSDREWTCTCGTTHDRDLNAAKNIKEYFFRTEGFSGIACGGADISLTDEAGRCIIVNSL